ncbi:MAG: HAD hydrolase family protein [Lachnospiraceae bacterium]|nr:HAD hydrolase family protein [Lachnospiraceae bacterium]
MLPALAKKGKGPVRKLPHIGLRIVKSAVATFLCLVVDLFRQGTPFYSVLAVLQCMQPYRENTMNIALQRTTGTLVGAAYGLVVVLLELNVLQPLGFGGLWWFVLLALSVVVVLYTTVLMNKKNASYFSCVVFLSIVINHLEDANPYLFVLNRVTDTMIGIVIGMAVNSFHLPRRLDRDVLYAVALNDVLVGRTDGFSDFSKVELNRMLDAGIQFTIMTIRTPASYLEVAKDIRVKLPVILMNGAVLYDIKNNLYLRKLEIPYEEAREIKAFICGHQENCFTNIIEENSVIILYDRLENEGERAVYSQLRKSPYRNYNCRPLEEGENVVYFMVVNTRERINALYADMERAGYAGRYRILHYDSDEYPGYAYLKLYHRDATKQHMLQELQEYLKVPRICTIGSVAGEYDLVMDEAHPGDAVVRKLYHLCMPVSWPGKKSGVRKRIFG